MVSATETGQKDRRDGQREQLLSVGEAATYLAVHVNTIRRWTRDGFLPCFRVGPRRDRRIRRSDLDRLLRQVERAAYPASSAYPARAARSPSS